MKVKSKSLRPFHERPQCGSKALFKILGWNFHSNWKYWPIVMKFHFFGVKSEHLQKKSALFYSSFNTILHWKQKFCCSTKYAQKNDFFIINTLPFYITSRTVTYLLIQLFFQIEILNNYFHTNKFQLLIQQI